MLDGVAVSGLSPKASQAQAVAAGVSTGGNSATSDDGANLGALV